MNTQEALRERIGILSDHINALSAERDALRQLLTESQTTLKVGDRVTFHGAKHVWEITDIGPGYREEPKFYGRKIKKDGTPGSHRFEIFVPYGTELTKIKDEN